MSITLETGASGNRGAQNDSDTNDKIKSLGKALQGAELDSQTDTSNGLDHTLGIVILDGSLDVVDPDAFKKWKEKARKKKELKKKKNRKKTYKERRAREKKERAERKAKKKDDKIAKQEAEKKAKEGKARARREKNFTDDQKQRAADARERLEELKNKKGPLSLRRPTKKGELFLKRPFMQKGKARLRLHGQMIQEIDEKLKPMEKVAEKIPL